MVKQIKASSAGKNRNTQKVSIAIFKRWLPAAIITTGLCGLGYLIGQQILRQSANDPQIQIAEDAAAQMQEGNKISSYVFSDKVDLAKSLETFLIVFDDNRQPILSSAILDGTTPTLPDGVFEYVKTHGEDRITWQPKSGVRFAAVVTRYSGKTSGYVMAGRSLREVEKREDQLFKNVGLAWITIIAFSLSAYILLQPKD